MSFDAKYEQVGATSAMHQMPRFGHASDFSKLFSKDEDEVTDYALGLIFGGALVITFFVIWLLVILVFKCLGQRRVGFLSGAPFTKTPEISAVGGNVRRPMITRCVFLSSGVILIVFGVLLVTQGITNLRDTISNVYYSNEQIASITRDAEDISTSLRLVGVSAAEIRNTIVGNLGNFCPDEVDVEAATGHDIDAIAQDTVDLLDDLGDFLNEDLVTLEDSLNTTTKASEDVDEVVNDIDLNDWQALIVLIPLIVVPSLLMVGVLMAMFESSNLIYTRVIDWCLLPIFVLITLFAICGCGAIMVVSTVNADWCYGEESTKFSGSSIQTNSPDGTVLNIMDELGFEQTDLVFRGVKYYVTQCIAEDPFVFITEYKTQLDEGNATMNDLVGVFDDIGVSRLSVICGIDYAPFEALVKIMVDNLRVLLDNVSSVLSLLECDRIVPIYTNLAYEATCKYSVTGATWIWSSLLVISTCALIMIMLRSSWQETVFEDQMLMNKDLGDAEYQEGQEFEGFEEEAYMNQTEESPNNGVAYDEPQMYMGDDDRGRNEHDMQ
mmetsp:Transcript_12647/g.17943  ORF Transcript_12647/g.17943 Transcript_12647/m.17943 type:complete len:552 (+) Transcript_12647:136-1791(+)